MSKKRIFSSKNESWTYPAVLSLLVFVATYSIMLVAIDSGSLLAYLASFVGVYYSVRYLKIAVKLAFSNDKNSRARAAKKAH